MPKLGVNIDHVATLRQARREFDPDPISAAQICEKAGADSIVAHLREDQRHMKEGDIRILRKIVKTRFNLEMSINEKIVQIAAMIKPHQATLVPERREEITTEGGLDVIRHAKRIKETVEILQKRAIEVSLFIDPEKRQIKKSKDLGLRMIELHTGCFARSRSKSAMIREVKNIRDMTQYARSLHLVVNAGHGLKYHNTKMIAQIEGIEELNIGHAIISRAIFIGLEKAVQEMKKIVS